MKAAGVASRLDRAAPALLALGLAVLVASVWSVEFFPSQDGPQHVGLVVAWDQYAQEAVYQTYFEADRHLAPNWSTMLALLGLVNVVDPVTADRLLVTVLVVSFGLCAWYATTAVGRRGAVAALVLLPVATSWYLHRGSYNFVASLCLFLVVVGYWLRHGQDPTRRNLFVLGLLLVVTYFSHVVSLIEAWLVLAALVIGWSVTAAVEDGSVVRARLMPDAWRRVRPIAVASLPALLLLVAFVLTGTRSVYTDLSWSRLTFGWVRSFVSLVFPLVSFNRWEQVFAALLALTTAIAVVVVLVPKVRARRFTWIDSLLGLAPVLALIAALSPASGLGGSSIRPRLAVYPFLVVVMWLAGQDLGNRLRAGLVAGSVVATVGLVGLHLQAYQQYDDEIREVVSAAASVDEGSTVLPVTWIEYIEPPYYRIQPLLYTNAWIAAERRSVDLGNLDALTGFAPLRFRPHLDPATQIHTAPFGLEAPPPEGDFLTYEERTGGSVDYVLLIGFDRQDQYEAEKQEFLRQLAGSYDLVHRSEESSLVRLYKLRR